MVNFLEFPAHLSVLPNPLFFLLLQVVLLLYPNPHITISLLFIENSLKSSLNFSIKLHFYIYKKLIHNNIFIRLVVHSVSFSTLVSYHLCLYLWIYTIGYSELIPLKPVFSVHNLWFKLWVLCTAYSSGW